LLVFEDDDLADRAELDLCPIGAGDDIVFCHGSSLQVGPLLLQPQVDVSSQ
jgi:hypothetical protein